MNPEGFLSLPSYLIGKLGTWSLSKPITGFGTELAMVRLNYSLELGRQSASSEGQQLGEEE